MRFVLNVMGEELNLMNEIERIILDFNESVKDNGHPEQTICKVCIEDLAKALEQYVLDKLAEKKVYWEQDYSDLKKEHKRCVIKALEKETIVTHSDTEDWSDDKVSGYLLKIREIQKHIAKLKKGLKK